MTKPRIVHSDEAKDPTDHMIFELTTLLERTLSHWLFEKALDEDASAIVKEYGQMIVYNICINFSAKTILKIQSGFATTKEKNVYIKEAIRDFDFAINSLNKL